MTIEAIEALRALSKIGYLKHSACAGKEGNAVLRQARNALKNGAKQDKSNMKLINEMYEALITIKAICGEDIAVHFSKETAKKINKAIVNAEKNT